MGIVSPKAIQPPQNELPLTPGGQHSQAWAAFHQDVADQVSALGLGVTDGGVAPVGWLGERLSVAPAPVGLGTGIFVNVAALLLSAGDWDVTGNINFIPNAACHLTTIAAGLSLVPGALGVMRTQLSATFATGAAMALSNGGVMNVNVAVATTVYLVGFAAFTLDVCNASGTISARRMR